MEQETQWEEKGSKSRQKVRDIPTPTIRSSNKTPIKTLDNSKIHAEDLEQIHACFMIAALVSVRQYDSTLVDSISCLYMVSSTTLTPKTLPPTLPQGSSGSA